MLPLTESEGRVLDLVCEGLTNRQIWRRLYITESTVKTHLQRIYRKLGVNNRNAAAIWGRANGYGQKKLTSIPDLPFGKLSSRELEIVGLVAQGKTNPQIAATLEITPRTVSAHLTRIGKKLGEGDRQEIARAYNEFQASKEPSS